MSEDHDTPIGPVNRSVDHSEPIGPIDRPLLRQLLTGGNLTHPLIAELSPAEAAEHRRLMHEELALRFPQNGRLSPPAVPERFVGVRFATTKRRPDVDGFTDAAKATLRWVREIAAGDRPRLALIGGAGTGKSHLAYCAVWELFERHGIRMPCYSWYELVDQLRGGRIDATPSGSREVTPAAVRQSWFESPYCVVDEVRPTSGTDFDGQELAKFTMNRYDRSRAVLLTCNWSSLADLMGEPAADRYLQVKLSGSSYRQGAA